MGAALTKYTEHGRDVTYYQTSGLHDTRGAAGDHQRAAPGARGCGTAGAKGLRYSRCSSVRGLAGAAASGGCCVGDEGPPPLWLDCHFQSAGAPPFYFSSTNLPEPGLMACSTGVRQQERAVSAWLQAAALQPGGLACRGCVVLRACCDAIRL